jgi:hypothetical protein
MRFLVKALGWAMLAFAAVGVASEIDDALKGKSHDTAVAVVMVTLFAGGGLLLLRAGRRMKGAGEASAGTGPSIEQRVLLAARRNRGHLTAVSAAADGSLTIDQAREELERLAKANACLMEVSSDGLVVFRFPEFEPPDSRPSA